MKRFILFVLLVAALSGCATTGGLSGDVILDFESYELPPEGYANGSSGIPAHTLEGVSIPVAFNAEYKSWSGGAISNRNDTTTAGYTNQYSVYAGEGNRGSGAFAVLNRLEGAEILFDTPARVVELWATNMTYAALSMRDGDQFAKKFNAADGDFFKVTFAGIDAAGGTTGSVELYLGDFRQPVEEPILKAWRKVDLRGLGTVAGIRISFESSDVGSYGMNTPAYVAIDDLRYQLAR